MSAVEAVGPVGGVELLESLVSKSLVQRAATDGPARFQMLEVVRAYCEQKIGKLLVHQARRSQAFWMLERARRWTEAESLSSADAHDDLATDLPNLLFALDWFEEHGCRRDLLDLVARAGGVFMHRGPVMEGAARARATEALMATACPVHDLVHDDPVGRDRRGFFLASFAGMSLSAGDTSTSFRVRIGASELVGAEPYDWAVDALGILGVGYEMGRPDGAGLSLIERAAALAPATRSADLNTALASTCLAQSFLMRRRYRDAVPAFARAAAAERARGRVLLQAETGQLGALHLLGDHDAAASLAASTRSKVGTDSWHYLIDVLRAIALAPGDPVLAADVLDTVLGVHPGDELPGRTGDIAVASGVLARLAGRDETGFELLRSGMGRLPIISALQAEYLLDEPRRPMADDAWSDHWEATVVAAYQAQLEQPDGWVQEQILPGRVRSQLEQLRLDDDRETETT